MASVQYLFSLTQTFAEEIRRKEESLVGANIYRDESALLIQRTWRCYAARKKFKFTLACVVTVQSYCRGWHARKNRMIYELAHKDDLHRLLLNRMATVVQATWRGYIYRKYHQDKNPRKRLADRKHLDKITAEMRNYMKNEFETNKQNELKGQAESDKNIVLFILFKCHHMLRTKLREGIFSCHKSNELSLIEQLMKALPLKEYMSVHKKKYYDTLNEKKDPEYVFLSPELRKYEDMLKLRDKTHDVRPERMRGYNIHEQRFKFPTKHEYRKYERELGGMEKYGKRCSPIRSNRKNLYMSTTDFLLGERMDLKDKSIPYYVDLWEKFKCDLHNVDFID